MQTSNLFWELMQNIFLYRTWIVIMEMMGKAMLFSCIIQNCKLNTTCLLFLCSKLFYFVQQIICTNHSLKTSFFDVGMLHWIDNSSNSLQESLYCLLCTEAHQLFVIFLGNMRGVVVKLSNISECWKEVIYTIKGNKHRNPPFKPQPQQQQHPPEALQQQQQQRQQ